MPGPPRTPTHLLVVRGSRLAKDRAASEPKVDAAQAAAPKKPAYLDKRAAAVWRKLLPLLLERRVLTVADGSVFGEHCQAAADVERLARDVAADGEVVTTPNGSLQRHPKTVLLREARARLLPDPTAASTFYNSAFGLATQLRLGASEAPTTGFRGFTLSLVVSQPATVNGLIGGALDAGATLLKPAAKSFWGYGGVVRAPDGTIWKVATSAKKNTGPPTRQIDQIVLLLGATDVAASKRFYVDRGLAVAKSFGRKYVEFTTQSAHIKLALYGRRALAKDAGVSPDGTGSHRIIIGSDAGPFTDPDGFAWQAASL